MFKFELGREYNSAIADASPSLRSSSCAHSRWLFTFLSNQQWSSFAAAPSFFIDRRSTNDLRTGTHLIVGLKNGNIYRFDREEHTVESRMTIKYCRIPEYVDESSVQHPVENETLLLHWNLSSISRDRLHRTNEMSHSNGRVLLTVLIS